MYEVNEEPINKLSLEKVVSEAEFREVMELRIRGYRGLFSSAEAARDERDSWSNCDLLLAKDSEGTAVGTLRILNTLEGDLELDSLNPTYRSYFPERTTFVEGSRLVAEGSDSIPKQSVQAAMWKATLDYAFHKEIDQLIVWAKRGPDRAYRYLKFTELPECNFSHPQLGGKEHRVFAMDVKKIRRLAKSAQHPLYDFFFEKRYPGLIWY